MIVIGLADVHDGLPAVLSMMAVVRAADVVVFAGDLTHFGGAVEAERVVSPVSAVAGKTFAVSGNCDYPEVDAWLERMGLNLHGRGEMVDGVGFLGLGGSLITPFRTPNEYAEDDIEGYLNQGLLSLPPSTGAPLILVSHQPPYGTRCDRLSNGTHVGSNAVRRFIETHRPQVCFTGHIHESAAVDNLGPTRIINPGMLGRGQYAWAEINPHKTVVEIRRVPPGPV